MSTQFFLDELDIEALAELMLLSQLLRTREALCLKIGLDYRQLWFIKDTSDSDFVIQLIDHLNKIGNKEALCKLCSDELFPIFRKSETSAHILSKIAAKLNCNQELRPNYSNNESSSSAPDSYVNSSNQPEISKPQSIFTLIYHHRNKLFAFAAILVFGLVGYPAYESFNQASPQLVEDKALTQNAALVWSEAKGNIGEYKENAILVKKTHDKGLRNFTIEAQFDNPYDGAMNNWTYGFAFQENTSQNLNDPKRKSFDIWVTSKEKEWRFGTTARSLSDKLPNLDVSNNSSNKLRLTVKGEKASFFVNDIFIGTFDVSEFTNKGDVFLLLKDGISGKYVKYENLKVWSLDN